MRISGQENAMHGKRVRSLVDASRQRFLHIFDKLGINTIGIFGIFGILTRPLSDYQYVLLRQIVHMREFPNISEPKLFNEKFAWRILNDRRPILKEISNKLSVREYYRSRGLEDFLPRLFFVADDARQLTNNRLPNSFALKASHGSGMNIFVPRKAEIDLDFVRWKFENWLRHDYYLHAREWQYKDSPRHILVEEYLEGGNDGLLEMKFHCFDGEPQIILITKDRFNSHRRSGRFDMNWKLLPFHANVKGLEDMKKPKRLLLMI